MSNSGRSPPSSGRSLFADLCPQLASHGPDEQSSGVCGNAQKTLFLSVVDPLLPFDYLSGLNVDPVHLEHVLCNIQSVCRSIHLGPPFLKWTC